MEYLVFIGALAAFFLFLFLKGAYDARKDRKRFEARLVEDYGQAACKEYKLERFFRLDRFYRAHPAAGQIDDITWNDLSLDEVFKQMDYTLSSTGQEYLYYTLRTPRADEEGLLHLEEMARYFDENPKERMDVQLLMKQLGGTGNYSLYDYLEYLENLGKRSNRKHWTAILLICAMVAACFFQPSVGIVGIVCLMCYNITTYFKEKSEIEPYVVSLAYIMRLLYTSGKLAKLPIPVCTKEWEEIQRCEEALSSMRTGSFWVISSGNTGVGGNPLEILMDYIRMVFHVDIIVFNRMLSHLSKHLDAVDSLVCQVGLVETSICVASYRKYLDVALQEGWCEPEFVSSKGLSIQQAYHPLVSHPVKNGLSTRRGVLLTGSNASGKSTFLKTVAINALLAQTIHTCAASSYSAPFFRILSSMALHDDLEGGESYYIVEIKSLKRVLEAGGKGLTVLCFVDEVLRGTNTVERIAASTQILKSLGGSDYLCFAATHDIELTDLLGDVYENYHFEEEVKDGDICFNYRLLPGKAQTRNAIRLLELMGYEEGIIRKATRQAEEFLATGNWKCT